MYCNGYIFRDLKLCKLNVFIVDLVGSHCNAVAIGKPQTSFVGEKAVVYLFCSHLKNMVVFISADC